MTREEQIRFCEKCSNRKMDMQQGIICNLTGEKATFQDKCLDFKLDESVTEKRLYDDHELYSAGIKQALHPAIIDSLRKEQNLLKGILAGLIAGIISAILWAFITIYVNFQIGFMAIAVGAIVGFTIRIFGKGVDRSFGFWGAGISLFSVLLGNILSIIGVAANEAGVGYFEALRYFDYSYLPQIMWEFSGFIDVIFYILAVTEGYKFSFRIISEKKIAKLKEKMNCA